MALPPWMPTKPEGGEREREADLDSALAAVLARRPGLAGATAEAVISRRVRLAQGEPGAAKRRDPTLGELRCRRDRTVTTLHARVARRTSGGPDYSVRVSRAAWEAARAADAAAGGWANREWLVAWLLAPAVAAGAEWTTDQHFADSRRVAMRHEAPALTFGLGAVVPGKRARGSAGAQSLVGRTPRRPELGRHTSVCLACRGSGAAGCPCARRADRLFAGQVCWRGTPLPDGATCSECGSTADVRRCTSGDTCLACLLADHAARCGCAKWAKVSAPVGTGGVPIGTRGA